MKDELSQSERRAVLATTLLDHAKAEAEPGGRFAAQAPIHHGVPKLTSGPWAAGDPTGREPPLGIDVNAMNPVGTAREIAQSIQALSKAQLPEPTANPSAGLLHPSEAVDRVGSGIRRRF